MKEYCLYEGNSKIENNGDNVFVTFFSNAQRFTVSYSVSDVVNGNFPHVGVTAREGLAILIRNTDKKYKPIFAWKPVDLLSKNKEDTINLSHIVKKGENYQIAIYGPILAHLDKLSIKINDDEVLNYEEAGYVNSKIFAGGGKHTFGIGVTSSAMMFSNILRRNYDVKVDRFSSYNITSVKAEYERIKQIDNISAYDAVIYEISKYNTDECDFEHNIQLLVRELCKSKKVIIWHSYDSCANDKDDNIAKLLELVTAQYENCRYMNLNFLFDEEQYTYSTNFLNDAANIVIYKELERNLRDDTWSI